MDDQKIIALYWTRNEDALIQTRSKYHQYCYRIAYNILQCHEEAEEVENDTYLDVWNTLTGILLTKPYTSSKMAQITLFINFLNMI